MEAALIQLLERVLDLSGGRAVVDQRKCDPLSMGLKNEVQGVEGVGDEIVIIGADVQGGVVCVDKFLKAFVNSNLCRGRLGALEVALGGFREAQECGASR